MTTYLLLGAIVVIACVLLNRMASRLGVPVLLAFIVLGMLFGSDGIVKIPFDDYHFAEQICSVALVFIMFYGGFGTNWNEAKPVAVKSLLLSSAGVLLTAGLTGLFCFFVLRFGLLESLLIGAVLSSTDAASVFSILRSKKLNLKYHTASLLEVESGSNDPFSYMLTIILLSVMNGKAGVGSIAYLIFAQIAYGVAFGVVIALGAVFLLRHFRFSTGFDTAFVLAVAVLAYALPAALGGNGYLSAYLAGMIMGNRRINNKKALVNFSDGINSLMQMLIFFLLGLLSFPSALPSLLLPSLLIALFLTFIARPLAVFAILSPAKCGRNQKLLVSWAGLRGAASIVFATVAVVHEATIQNDVFHITFFIVLLSIGFQGMLLPYVSRKLNMIDNDYNVLKTFNDYLEEAQVQFNRLAIDAAHPWQGKAVEDIDLPPDTLLCALIRENKAIIPKGNTILQPGDVAVLSAPSFQDRHDIRLKEVKITSSDNWKGKQLSELDIPEDTLVVMIKRADKIMIPSGKTVVRENDILVLNSVEE